MNGRGLRVMCVVGARPNFMKMKPIIDALDRRHVATTLVHTGQHYDDVMSDVFFEDLGLRRPDMCLGVGSGSHAEQVAAVMVGVERLINREKPYAVVVVGDVNSTLGAALAGAKTPSIVAHVEAGFRSGDWTMPEEVNRVVTDRLSDLLFAPSEDAVRNLRTEGFPPERIHLVGDIMAEMLLRSLHRAQERSILQELGLEPGGYALATIHRASNVDDPKRLAGLLAAIDRLADDVPVVFPVHPRTRGRMREHGLQLRPAVKAVEPLGYLDFIAVEAAARLALTDSGSVQEEAYVLGVPCLTLRNTTERRETLRNGSNQLVGGDPEQVVAAARLALARRRGPLRPRQIVAVGEHVVEVLLEGSG